MTPLPEVRVWDRRTGGLEVERQFHGDTLRWMTFSTSGRLVSRLVLVRRLFNGLYGWLQDRPGSQRKIAPFVARFGIDCAEFEPGPYPTFNAFFARRFRPGARAFETDPGRLPAPCEARYLAFDAVDAGTSFLVKGNTWPLPELLGRSRWAEVFEGGPALVARLSPLDYHRFHFAESGRVVDAYRLGGPLYSVHVSVLRQRPQTLWTNERHVTVVETASLGRLAQVEVGGMTVGRILQTYRGQQVTRGQEKGTFQFGASTVVVLGEPGRWRPDADLLEHSAEGIETLVRLGDGVATISSSTHHA